MPKFNYDIIIESPTELEADKKMKAISVLASKLSTKELEKMAYIIKNDPAKLAMAKSALGV